MNRLCCCANLAVVYVALILVRYFKWEIQLKSVLRLSLPSA